MSATRPSVSDFATRVFVFTGETFVAALDEWVAEQIDAFPRREELIRTTAHAMRDFMDSEQVRRHKMITRGYSDG